MMKAHRFWTLSLVAALAACTNDNPTGLSHVEDGVVINRVDDLAIYKFQQQMNTTSTLTCETISFDRAFAGGPYTHGSVLSGTNLMPMPFGVAVGVSVPIFDATAATGEARIYDTDTNGGEDLDLEVGGQLVPLHNVLMMQSTDTTEPNDAAAAGTIKFTFPAGDWFIRSYTALDQEARFGEFIQLDADGSDVAVTDITLENDSDFEIVTVGVVNVGVPFNTMLEFNFSGSGAIDDLIVCEMITRGGEGCTPGFWKQSQHFDSWPGGDTSIRFDEAFVNACNTYDAALQKPESGFLCDLSLLEALNLKGGGANALGRHAAAAWLNTQSVDFSYTQAEVEDKLEGALMTEDYEDMKNDFEAANEAGCPLN